MNSVFQKMAGRPRARIVRCRWQAFFIASSSLVKGHYASGRFIYIFHNLMVSLTRKEVIVAAMPHGELSIKHLEEKILDGGSLSDKEALSVSEVSGPDIFSLFASANKIRHRFRGTTAGLCSIINAKSGACSEDCSFCAQSSKSEARIDVYPLLNKEKVIQKARRAKRSGVKRFSIVTSGKKVSQGDLSKIADMVSEIRKLGLLPCASLGLLGKDEFSILKKAGLDRYHHNLESSARFFPMLCSTHGYADKTRTIEAAQYCGLSVCSGGIFGMGETWRDRIEMALALRKLDVESVPVNFLIPIKGSALEHRELLHALEALKIVGLYRLILPQKEIRICGGRLQVLGEFNSMVFLAGADGMITGDYLTTLGRSPKDDIRLIETYGLTT
jgi:biotin synthase